MRSRPDVSGLILRRAAACGLMLLVTAGAACGGGLRKAPPPVDAATGDGPGDGAAGKSDSGSDVRPDLPPGDASPGDVPLDGPADVSADRPGDTPAPMDVAPDVPPGDTAADRAMDTPGDTPAPDAPIPCSQRACSGAVADSCCPTACGPATDVDCPGCGNGRVETGETCDPLSTCPTACPPTGCMRFTLSGAGTCQATCVAAAPQTACVNADGCCPTGCNMTNDSDCAPRCGNGVVETGEMCDGNCPASCPAVGCQQRTLQGSAATCNARCVDGATTTTCTSNDSCCPTGCNTTNDADCVVRCGNGVVEAGEICDGNCPTSCPAVGCQLRVLTGTPAACNVQCVNGSQQTTCANGDACCPTGCNSTNDSECQPMCGNSVLEPAAGETCDPPATCATQMAACVSDANTVRTSSGSVSACTYVCTSVARACGPADGFCPTGCGPTADVDCPGCGNGRIESGETCDVSPATVICSALTCNDGDACTVDTRTGSNAACNVACTNTAITACTGGDGCCPGGGRGQCNRNNDSDCAAVCGNGAVESGETCDPLSTCPTSCPQQGCVLPTLVSGGTCAAACVDQGVRQTACVDGDGCCPVGAAGGCSDINDSDCPTPNDLCPNARDISAGGDFPFSLMTAKAESTSQCAPAGPEVFFKFTLPAPSGVYLDVFDPTGKPVNVALDVWANDCPGVGSFLTCDVNGGQKNCGGETWPRIFFTNTDLRTFVVAARATNSVRGRYTLRFQYVPLACIAAGALTSGLVVDNTCQGGNQYSPTCATAAGNGLDKTYYLVKCPATALTVSTCEGRTGNTNTVLYVNRGSLNINAASGRCAPAPSGREVACNDNATPTCTAANPNASALAGVGAGDRGVFTITVDTVPVAGGPNCGSYGLNSTLQ